MKLAWRVAAVAAVASLLGGCGAMGPDKKKALYTLPKGSKVLVFVDAHPGLNVPLDVLPALGEAVSDHLYKYKAADKFVGQPRVIALRQSDPERFAGLSTEEVARETGADVVIQIDLTMFSAEADVGGQLTQGQAEGLVKVVTKDGRRLWPKGDGPGAGVAAAVSPNLVETQELGGVRKKLIRDMAARIGRAFHEWDPDDKEVNR